MCADGFAGVHRDTPFGGVFLWQHFPAIAIYLACPPIPIVLPLVQYPDNHSSIVRLYFIDVSIAAENVIVGRVGKPVSKL